MIETVLGRISSIWLRGNSGFLVDAGGQDQLVGRFAAEQAVIDLAVGGGHGDRLEAAHQAGAGKDDGLQQVALGSHRADPGQIGADVSAAVADRMAGETGGLLAVEDELAPANVARRQRGHELLQPRLLLGRVDVETGVERLGLAFERPGRISPGEP